MVKSLRSAVSGGLLLVVTVLVLLPIILMVVNSFRTNDAIIDSPIGLPDSLYLGNFQFVLERMDIVRGTLVSAVLSAATIGVVIVVGAAASWAIARTTRRWSKAAYQLFIAGLTVPIFVLLTPLYLQLLQLGLLNNIVTVVLVYAALNLPFAIFFYTSFLRNVPQELEQAAAVDGCGPLRTFWHVILPMLRPTSAAMGIFTLISIWNDVTIPLLLLNSDQLQPLTLSIYSFVGTQGAIQQSQIFPAVLLATLPLFVLFLVFQRQIVAGISAGLGK